MATLPLIYTKILGTASVNVPSTTETLITTLTGVAPSQPNQYTKLHVFAAVTHGADTTAVTFRLYRDSLSGLLVATSPAFTAAEATVVPYTWDAIDATGEYANGAYAVSVQATGASAASTVNAYALIARVD